MTNPFYPKVYTVLPKAIWLPRFGPKVYRGSASEIILDMASGTPARSVKAAIRQLVEDMTRNQNTKVQIPWDQPEMVLARSFLKALLQSGIARTVPEA